MRINAAITAYRRRTGTTGAGEPVLVDASLAHPIGCESIAPSTRAAHEAYAHGLGLERTVIVRAAALRAAGIEPVVGDRLTLRTARPWVACAEHDIDRIRPLDHASVELTLGSRRDEV